MIFVCRGKAQLLGVKMRFRLSLLLLCNKRRWTRWMYVRCVSVSGNTLRVGARLRLLHHTSLCSHLPHRHLVVGVFLDQRRVESGARHDRSTDRAGVTSDRGARVTSASDQWSVYWPCWRRRRRATAPRRHCRASRTSKQSTSGWSSVSRSSSRRSSSTPSSTCLYADRLASPPSRPAATLTSKPYQPHRFLSLICLLSFQFFFFRCFQLSSSLSCS